MSDDDLELDRPTPDPAFRGALGRRLESVPTPPPRPPALWAWVSGLGVVGIALLLVALSQI